MKTKILFFLLFFLTGAGKLTAVSEEGSRQNKKPENQNSKEKEMGSSEEQVSKIFEPLEFGTTVTATRKAVPISNIGFSIKVIERETIESQGAHTLAQVLETVPGFNVVRSGSYGGPTSVFVRGGESDFNLVMIDGVQINQPGGSLDFSNLSTTNVERIEIVRGPGSVLYGAEAVSSIINIVTTRGEGNLGANVRVEGGSFDTYRSSGGLSGGTENVGYSLSGFYSDTDGFLPFNRGYEHSEFSGRLDLKLWTGAGINTMIRHRDSEQHFPTDSSGDVVDPNDFRVGQDTIYSMRFNQVFNSRYTSTIQYGHHFMKATDFTIADGVRDDFDFTFERQNARNYFDWQNDLILGDRHLLTMGLSYDKEESGTHLEERHSVGFYAQDQFSVKERFFFTTGFRFDKNDRFKDFIAANFSASFRIHPYARLKASVGNGFRSPSFDEILGFPNFEIKGNTQLKPEQNVGVDAGVDFYFPLRPSGVSVSVFLNHFSDLIEFSFAVPIGSPNYLNIEKARSQGVEFEAFHGIWAGFKLGGGYTFTDTKVTDSGSAAGDNFIECEKLLRSPRQMGFVYLSRSGNRLSGRMDFKFKGNREDRKFFPDFTSARVELPGYLKIDFGLRFSILRWNSHRDLAVTVRGENILNEEYEEVAGFASPGRRVMVGLRLGF